MESPVASGSRLVSQPFPSASSQRKREEDLVYLFEAEEERITNLLSRKLEQLKEEKVELENLLEAESESHVNRLSKELAALRAFRDQQQAASNEDDPSPNSSGHSRQVNGTRNGVSFALPPQNVMLEAMRRENEELRNRLVESERSYIRISRLNDIYREELIELRRRLGMPIDNLIGLPSSSADIYSQPTHLRSQTSVVRTSSAADTMVRAQQASNGDVSTAPPRPQLSGLPIPISRAPSSQTHRPAPQQSYSSSTTPNTTSPSSSLHSPFPFSPTTTTHINGVTSTGTTTSSSTNSIGPGGISPSPDLGASSYLTQMTTPPSSTSPLLQLGEATPFGHQLSYPSVPPPSLSSSLGSPVYSRRNSFGQANRRTSMDRGSGRIAETGSLRNRRASVASGGMPLTSETVVESPPGSPPSSVIGPSDY